MPEVSSGYSTTANVTTVEDDWWIKDLDVPADNLLVTVAMESLPIQTPQTQAIFEPLGGVYDIVVMEEAIRSDRFDLTVDFISDTQYNKLVALRAKNKTLLLQSPSGDQWYFVFGPGWAEEIRSTAEPWRFITFNVIEVEQPT